MSDEAAEALMDGYLLFEEWSEVAHHMTLPAGWYLLQSVQATDPVAIIESIIAMVLAAELMIDEQKRQMLSLTVAASRPGEDPRANQEEAGPTEGRRQLWRRRGVASD